jgi:hypothetical protein
MNAGLLKIGIENFFNRFTTWYYVTHSQINTILNENYFEKDSEIFVGEVEVFQVYYMHQHNIEPGKFQLWLDIKKEGAATYTKKQAKKIIELYNNAPGSDAVDLQITKVKNYATL